MGEGVRVADVATNNRVADQLVGECEVALVPHTKGGCTAPPLHEPYGSVEYLQCVDVVTGRHCPFSELQAESTRALRKGVLDALDVTSRTGIAVEKPCPADVFGHLEHARSDAEFSHPV